MGYVRHPAMILLAETRRHLHGQPQAKIQAPRKFGNDPTKHIDFSPITHIAERQRDPTFPRSYMLLTIPIRQRKRNGWEISLNTHGVPVSCMGQKKTDHSKINQRLGEAATQRRMRCSRFAANESMASLNDPAAPDDAAPDDGVRS